MLLLHLAVAVRSGGGGGFNGRGRQCGDDVLYRKSERRRDGEVFDGESGAKMLVEGELSRERERQRSGVAAASVRHRRKEAGGESRRRWAQGEMAKEAIPLCHVLYL